MLDPRPAAPARPLTFTADTRLQQMRQDFVNTGWTGLALLVAVILGITLWRVSDFPSDKNWQGPLASVTLLALVFYTLYLFRRRLPYTLKASVLVGIFLLGGATSLPVFGYAGGGSTAWMVTGCIIAALLFSKRVAMGAIGFATLVLGLAGWAFVSGWHKLPVNLNIMLTQWPSWANVMVSVAATTGIITLALAAYSRGLLQALKELENQRDQIEHMASHDNLTGLPMLRLAVDRCDMAIRHAQRAQQKVALLFIDLDGFKAVNDTFGHEAGDHVLREVAKRLKSSVRAADTAARIGGDEFVILLTGLENADFAGDVAAKLIRVVGQPIAYEGQELEVGASVGISIFPDHATDTLALRKAADEAMYSAKKAGKNRHQLAQVQA